MDDNFTTITTATDPSFPTPCRRDGWTDFARRLFLEVLSETGRVSRACEYARMSPQSAYALRNRDAMFAAGWDAACALARAPLADALREQAIDGLTETIRRDGEIVAERHRHDTRLSIAVLHRLDKRCDRAEEQGAHYLPLVARWDEWLGHVGRGEDEAALELLENADRKIAPDHQLHQLSLGENPTAVEDRELEELEFWKDGDGTWKTDFPPPLDFDGIESGAWGDYAYSRDCTAAEVALLDRADDLDKTAERGRAECRRDQWLADIQAELEDQADLPPAPSPA